MVAVMTCERRAVDRNDVWYLRVTEPPPPERVQAARDRVTDLILRRRLARVLIDYRDLKRSDIDARGARTLLTRMERRFRDAGHETPFKLRIALLSTDGTFGHGIGRMLVAHAYDLCFIWPRQFTEIDAAYDWLCAGCD